MEHIPGKGNVADFLSRYPAEAVATEWIPPEDHLDSIVDYSLPKHVSKAEILEATVNDPVLQKLSEMIENSRFSKADIITMPFARVFERLSLSVEGLIIKDDYQIVVPESLQDKVIKIAHEGHLGVAKTKQLLRSKVWFPSINIKVEMEIKKCLACQAVVDLGTSMTPIVMSELPTAPWTEVSIDFYGPIHQSNEYLMVIVDDYSRFPIVEIG